MCQHAGIGFIADEPPNGEASKVLNVRQYKQSVQKTQSLDILLIKKQAKKQKESFFRGRAGISFFFTFSF
jgi:hypothetical protein